MCGLLTFLPVWCKQKFGVLSLGSVHPKSRGYLGTQYQSSYSLLRLEPTVEYNGGGGNLVRRAQSIKTTQLKCLFTETVSQTDEDVFSGPVSSVDCPCSIQGCVCVCVCVCVSHYHQSRRTK